MSVDVNGLGLLVGYIVRNLVVVGLVTVTLSMIESALLVGILVMLVSASSSTEFVVSGLLVVWVSITRVGVSGIRCEFLVVEK